MRKKNYPLDGVDNIDAFKEVIEKLITVAGETLVKKGAVSSRVFVLKGSDLIVYPVPDGHNEMAECFIGIVSENENADGYVFITETWSISVPIDSEHEDIVKEYLRTPGSIANNPFKDETLTFDAKGFGEEFSGHRLFTRSDDGKIILGDLEFDYAKDMFGDVADLLKPMVSI